MSNTMSIIFLGVESAQGKKKEGGTPYGPFYTLYHATRIQQVNRDNRQVNGHGLRVQEVNISPELFDKFYGVTPLTKCEIVLEPDPNNFARTIIADVLVPSK